MRPALLAFVIYLGGAFTLGEFFPFSRYTMYADIAERDYGAVPVFLADGQAVDPSTLSSFHGLDPAQFQAPLGVVTAMDYVIDGWRDQVGRNAALSPGPVKVAVAYDLVRVREGAVQRQRVVVAEGTAWR